MDKKIRELVRLEEKRQRETLMMIPSENYASAPVRAALGSVLTNKYSEGYPGKRYYQGNKFVDKIENLAIERAKKLFAVPHANVQAYSGSPANAAVYFALLKRGDKIMGLSLQSGGHLTHGHPKITFSGRYFQSVRYEINSKSQIPNSKQVQSSKFKVQNIERGIDYEEVEKLARRERPKIIVSGATAYPRILDFRRFGEIAQQVGAWHLADISHLAGLIVAGVHPSPVPEAEIVMTTTHKTLRGPRGAILMVTERGLKKDEKLPEKIDRAVFPGLQGGPHNNVTAAIAVCLYEAAKPKFREYGRQVVRNAKVLAESLLRYDFQLVTGGTDNHLLLIDLRNKGVEGHQVATALEEAGIIVNKNAIPADPNPPFYPSGIRLGTPALTTRGMGEKEMRKIAGWINEVVELLARGFYQPAAAPLFGSPTLQKTVSSERRLLASRPLKQKLKKIKQEVKKLCQKFPLPS